MTNRLTWQGVNRQKSQGEKKRRIQELEAKIAELDTKAGMLEARVKEIKQIYAVQISAHVVGSRSNKRLAKRYSKVAKKMTGRPVKVRIQEPSTKEGVGLFSRTKKKGHIALSPELNAGGIIHTFLHEVGHCRLHWNTMRPSKSHLDLPRTTESPANSPKNPERYARHEDEATDLADTVVAILNTYIDVLNPDYENQALSLLMACPQHKIKS